MAKTCWKAYNQDNLSREEEKEKIKWYFSI